MDRTTSRTNNDEETTDFSYLGLSGEVLNEEIAGEVQKSYQYSPWGQRLSQVKFNTDGTSEDGFYGYNPHTDVETLTDDTGNTTSTYGYTAYGKDDEAEFTGVDAPDAGTPGDEPYNVYRYNSKRWDGASGTYDMGFRDYSPGLNRFLSRDTYTGALADLNLSTSPWNNNRYAFTSGNPTTMVELDGHRSCAVDCMSGDAYQDPTGKIHDPSAPDYSELPDIGRPTYPDVPEIGGTEEGAGTSWPEFSWSSAGFGAAGLSKHAFDSFFYPTFFYPDSDAGRHSKQPKHRFDARHQKAWHVQASSTAARFARGSFVVGGLASLGLNLTEDENTVQRSFAETGVEVVYGAAITGVVGLACGVTVGLGCGAAVVGGAALLGWTSDAVGEAGADIIDGIGGAVTSGASRIGGWLGIG